MGAVKQMLMEQQEQERNFKMEELEHEALVDITKPVTYIKETMQIENKKEREPECRYGHICTSSCGNDRDCPCEGDHCCELTNKDNLCGEVGDCEYCTELYAETAHDMADAVNDSLNGR